MHSIAKFLSVVVFIEYWINVRIGLKTKKEIKFTKCGNTFNKVFVIKQQIYLSLSRVYG
jgi:hypothetical protein